MEAGVYHKQTEACYISAMLYKAIAKVLWRAFSIFNVSRGAATSVVTLIALAGIVGVAYFGYVGSYFLLLVVVLALVFIAAVQIQMDLDRARHEGRGLLEIIPDQSQVSASPALWKNVEGIDTEKIRDSMIEIALEIRFNNKQAYPVDIRDFELALYKHRLWDFPLAKLPTETQYVLHEILERKSIKPVRFRTAANSQSERYYLYAWVTIPSGMGAFFAKMKRPVLLLHYRVDNELKRHDVRIEIDWMLVRSKSLAANTVLSHADVC
jgi:hypothetical protein